MEHNQNHFAPEAATHEPASSFFNSRTDGAGEPARDSRPRPPDEEEGLISDQLGGYVPVATDALGRRRRCDGFAPDRQVVFLEAFARCGVVADAARAAGISRDTAYSLRNSAEGAAFALGWDAAFLKSRARMADDLQSRALNGVVDKIYRNGELWGERHRHDNRLAMAVLTRLDRQAEGLGEGAATARIVAREWDQFLDIVEDGGDGAGEFLASRAAKERELAKGAQTTATGEAGIRVAEDLYHSLEAFERLFAYSMFGGGLEGEADLSGLEPAAMESWTDNDWLRADRGGILDSLRAHEWPEAVREPGPEATKGTCRNRQDIAFPTPGGPEMEVPPTAGREANPGLARACREYRRRFPAADRKSLIVEQTLESDHTRPDRGSQGGSG
ncbi:MAG: hypothetical protein QOJ27_769 [Sphingomonadales bacterium]|nr:hypothetical protein [Sphingomonadales bacterium]